MVQSLSSSHSGILPQSRLLDHSAPHRADKSPGEWAAQTCEQTQSPAGHALARPSQRPSHSPSAHIGNPDGHLFSTHRIGNKSTSKDTCFLFLGTQAFDLALTPGFINICLNRRALCWRSDALNQRMFRRQHKEGHAKNRVRARREDWYFHTLATKLRHKANLGAL